MIHSTQSKSRIASAAGHRLYESLAQLGPGRGCAVVLTGPQGSGKSRMLRDLGLALPQWTVVSTAALPWNATSPGSLLTQLADKLPGHQAGLAQLDAEDLRTLLLIDDAHWADAESLRQIFEAIRALHHGVIAAVFTYPDGEPGNPDFPVDLLAQLADAAVHVPPLNAERLREFVFEATGANLPAQSLLHLQTLTGGQPALVRELLDSAPSDHWHQPNPEVIIPDHWIRRLEARQAGGDFTALNHLLAMDFPGGAPVDLLRALDPGFEEQLTSALERGLVAISASSGTQTLAFREPTDLAAARASATPQTLALLHRRAADYYRDAGDRDHELFHAAHAVTAPDNDLAMQISAHAERLSAQGLWLAASRTYRLAARVSGSASLTATNHLDSLESLVAASDIPQAKLQTDVLETGRADARSDSLRAYLSLHEGRRRESQFLLDRAWNALDNADNHDPALRARVASRHAFFHVLDWNPKALVHWSHITRNWAAASSPVAIETSYIALVGQAALDGRRPAEVPVVETSPELTRRHNMALGWLDLVHDDPLSARQRFTQVAPRDGSQRISLWIDAWHARSLLLLGELRAAEGIVERGLARAEQFGITFLTPLLLWTGATAAMYRGDRDLMRFYLGQLSVSHDVFATEYIPSSMCRMLAAVSNNEQAAALRIGHSLHDFCEAKSITQPGFWPWVDVFAQLLVQSGQADDAAGIVERARDRAAGSPIRSLHAKLAVPQASILIQRGDVDAGVKMLDGAAEEFEDIPLPFYQARVLYEYGRTLRRLGRRRIADDIFSRASEVFGSMGATEYVQRCDRERRVSGIGARHTGVGGLTPQEEEIAKHVAEGASNREVAQELFLSSKTIEYHLTRVYRKLGIRTRSELPRALADAS